MSAFTGKSDFCDQVEMFSTPQEICETAQIYLRGGLLDTSTPQKLVPYYTHLITSGSFSKEKKIITLSSESYIEIEEKRFISSVIYQCILWARKAKKEKSNFTIDFCKQQKNYYAKDELIYKSIIKIINKNSEIIKVHLDKDYTKACCFIENWLIPRYFFSIHTCTHIHFREKFIKFAKENGYTTNFYTRNGNLISSKGILSPIISRMCFDLNEYYKGEEKW